MNRRWYGAAGFALPILVLGIMVGMHERHRSVGVEYRLPIRGFDPRHLLSGRYIQYRVDYPMPVCSDANVEGKKMRAATACLEPPGFQWGEAPSANCRQPLQGYCDQGRFRAGIERFYLPEVDAALVEKAVVEKKGELLFMVSSDGKAAVKELFIEGAPWRAYLKNIRPEP